MHPTYYGCGTNTTLDRAVGARHSNARSLGNAASMPAWRPCSPSYENGPLGGAYRMRMGQARGNHPQHDHNAHRPMLSRPTCSLSWRGGAGALSVPTRPRLRLVIARRGRRTLGTDEAPSAACHCEEGPAHFRTRRSNLHLAPRGLRGPSVRRSARKDRGRTHFLTERGGHGEHPL
jgi:hypothetical protein